MCEICSTFRIEQMQKSSFNREIFTFADLPTNMQILKVRRYDTPTPLSSRPCFQNYLSEPFSAKVICLMRTTIFSPHKFRNTYFGDQNQKDQQIITLICQIPRLGSSYFVIKAKYNRVK